MSRSFKHFEWPDNYYIWLCDMIDLETHSGYSDLISFLYNTEFTWSVPTDSNRAQDGKNLRADYICDNPDDEGEWLDDPCSWLEMLIALARRVRVDLMPDFDIELEGWFWQFVNNKERKNYRFENNKERQNYKQNCRNSNKERQNYRILTDFLPENLPLFQEFATFSEECGKKVAKKVANDEKKWQMDEDIWRKINRYLAENYEF